MTREEMIDKLVAKRMELASKDLAIYELLEDAFRYGRRGYDEMSPEELLEEMEQWGLNEPKKGENVANNKTPTITIDYRLLAKQRKQLAAIESIDNRFEGILNLLSVIEREKPFPEAKDDD